MMPTAQEERVAPLAKGDWVAEQGMRPDLAKVRNVYWDSISREWVADLVLFKHDGTRIGRASPRMGGPGGFEPAVPVQYWSRIKKPSFPLSTDMSGYRDWKPFLTFIAFRDKGNA